MTLPAGERLPRISVVIATFNRAPMLRCALRSVLAQELSDFEVIVVGDRCTDDSAAAVATLDDPRVQWTNRESNCGNQSGPNNDGVSLARGELIAFLGHDDLWFPWHLGFLVPVLDAGSDFAHSMLALLGPEGVRYAIAAPPRGESYQTTFVPPSGWLVRKSVLEAIGGFRDHSVLSVGTDFDLQRRIARSGHSIAIAPRMSVLKFPSHWWRGYASGAAVPQERWLGSIQSDARTVERELLTSALVTSLSTLPNASPLRAFALVLGVSKRWIRDRLDRHPRIFGALLQARFRRQREALKRLRGL